MGWGNLELVYSVKIESTDILIDRRISKGNRNTNNIERKLSIYSEEQCKTIVLSTFAGISTVVSMLVIIQ